MKEQLETKCKQCRKCEWCTYYTNFNPITNETSKAYYCTFGNGIDGKQSAPTLDDNCPHFREPYKEDEGK